MCRDIELGDTGSLQRLPPPPQYVLQCRWPPSSCDVTSIALFKPFHASSVYKCVYLKETHTRNQRVITLRNNSAYETIEFYR